MGNYEQLKQSVSNVIKTNGNQEITGSILQNVLLTIISTVGANATFAGVATPTTNPGTPDGPVFYLASEAGTYSNFGSIELQDGLSVLMWNGSWSSQQILSIDDVPTAGSNNLVKSGGVQQELALGAVYDVSAKNPTAGPNNDGKFESLSSLLEDANLSTLIPTPVRKGGMSIKFIQTSDNKYVQYRLMANQWSTSVTDWQGIDDVPTAGSDNLVKSGGVAADVVNLYTLLKPTTIAIKGDSSIEYRINTTDCTAITLLLKNTSDKSGYFRIALYDASNNLINNNFDILINAGESYSRNIQDTSEVAYIIITSINSRTGELTITKNTNAIDNIQDLDKRTTDNENATILNKNILVDRVIPTDMYGYITSNGSIEFQSSGNNHRTDYIPVEQGDKISYTGSYNGGMSAVYGYDENKQPITQLLQTGDWTNIIVKIEDPSIKYVMAWGDISKGVLSIKVPAQHNISDIGSASQLFRDDFVGENISTNLFGYINSDGSINIKISGNNHRTDYFPVEQGSTIEYSGYYDHEGFPAVYGYDENKQPIAQLLPTGVQYINYAITIDNANIKYVMAWGDVNIHDLSVIVLPKYNAKKLSTIEIVDANGNGDYLTLEEAIWNNISDRGDVTKHRTIIVMPGTYTMNTHYGNDAYTWKAISNRNLSIVGVDRNTCILKNTKGKYVAGRNGIDDACLKLSGNVLIKNLTILASHEDFDGAEGTNPGAYCIHLDSGGADCNLEIDNCIMVDKQHACIGIGTADNYTIQIRNCRLVTEVDNPSSFSSWSGAIICHNNDYNNAATLRLENNVMKSNTPNTFAISRAGSYTSQIKLEAYRNIIGGNVSIDSGIVVLDELNFGNNKSELNYQS